MLTGIRDVRREVQELQSEQSGDMGQNAGSNDEPTTEACPCIDFQSDRLSPAEQNVASAAQELLRQVDSCLQLTLKALLKSEEPVPGSQLDAWESTTFHCRQLSNAAVDLGAGTLLPRFSPVHSALAKLSAYRLCWKVIP